jgi:hypothetical protein
MRLQRQQLQRNTIPFLFTPAAQQEFSRVTSVPVPTKHKREEIRPQGFLVLYRFIFTKFFPVFITIFWKRNFSGIFRTLGHAQ